MAYRRHCDDFGFCHSRVGGNPGAGCHCEVICQQANDRGNPVLCSVIAIRQLAEWQSRGNKQKKK